MTDQLFMFLFYFYLNFNKMIIDTILENSFISIFSFLPINYSSMFNNIY